MSEQGSLKLTIDENVRWMFIKSEHQKSVNKETLPNGERMSAARYNFDKLMDEMENILEKMRQEYNTLEQDWEWTFHEMCSYRDIVDEMRDPRDHRAT